MKTRILSLVVMFLIGTATVFAGNKTEKFLVNGNCDMCKKRIEIAAISVAGVSKADWNKETKEITVTIDDAKTNVMKVHEAIAAVGHDTNLVKASDDVYKKLPDCCKYDRANLKSQKNEMKHDHN